MWNISSWFTETTSAARIFFHVPILMRCEKWMSPFKFFHIFAVRVPYPLNRVLRSKRFSAIVLKKFKLCKIFYDFYWWEFNLFTCVRILMWLTVHVKYPRQQIKVLFSDYSTIPSTFRISAVHHSPAILFLLLRLIVDFCDFCSLFWFYFSVLRESSAAPVLVLVWEWYFHYVFPVRIIKTEII